MAAMYKAYDREELVARFGPRPHCGPIEGAELEVPIRPTNELGLVGVTRELLDKPPKPQGFDCQREGGLAIKPNYFKSLSDGQTTQTTQTTKFEHGGQRSDFPAEWHAVLDEIKGSTPVEGFGDARWQSLVDDMGIFLPRWGEAAHLLGWTALDLFGVHPAAPAVRFDVMGLLPLLHGDSVVALTTDEARIRRPSRAILTFRRADQAGAVLVTRCLQRS
jgi:hypothetical protein